MVRRILVFLLGLSFCVAFEANAGAPAAWYQQVSISYVYAGTAGGRIAVAVDASLNFGDCFHGAPGNEFALDVNHPFFKQMFMMIMTAYTLGKPINLYTNGVCAGGGLFLADVWLPK